MPAATGCCCAVASGSGAASTRPPRRAPERRRIRHRRRRRRRGREPRHPWPSSISRRIRRAGSGGDRDRSRQRQHRRGASPATAHGGRTVRQRRSRASTAPRPPGAAVTCFSNARSATSSRRGLRWRPNSARPPIARSWSCSTSRRSVSRRQARRRRDAYPLAASGARLVPPARIHAARQRVLAFPTAFALGDGDRLPAGRAVAAGRPSPSGSASTCRRRSFNPAISPEPSRTVLKETGFSPSLLELEVTEDILLEDEQSALETFRRVQELGVASPSTISAPAMRA